jgi:hypothetical protein
MRENLRLASAAETVSSMDGPAVVILPTITWGGVFWNRDFRAGGVNPYVGRLSRIAAIAASNSGVGIGAPIAHSAAQ